MKKVVVYGLAYTVSLGIFSWAWVNGFILHCRDRLEKT